MIRLATVTSIMICLCVFAPLRENSLVAAQALSQNIVPAKAQRRKEESATNSTYPALGLWHWAPGSTVNVYVTAGEFNEDEISHLLAPLTTWNAASSETGSQVKFEYKGLTKAPLNCTNCLTITRGPVFDKKHRHLTELRSLNDPQRRTMLRANIVIDPRLTNHETLTNAVAHELGHSFGLVDCYSCKEKSTVMNQFKSANIPNQMNGPTTCDVAQVKSVYRAHASHALQKRTIVVDEGEEPVDDDTPVVIPKP
jgi:hypothetical protein